MGSTAERGDDSDVVLFYLYKALGDEAAVELAARQRRLGSDLALVGRVLVAAEGINGTVQGDFAGIAQYKIAVEEFLGTEVDWKHSHVGAAHLFPDFVVKEVAELVSFGLPRQAFADMPLDVAVDSAVHLPPDDFHQLLTETPSEKLHVVDVRNAFEFEIGHFDGALDPGMTHTAQWPRYVDKHLEEFRNKNVMLYCTGGIRCEKASAYLCRRLAETARVPPVGEHESDNVCSGSTFRDAETRVYQLQGGIHRYLEAFPDGGHFRGTNFVFDRRVQMQPAQASDAEIIGTCSECGTSWDRHHGGRVCCVCRKLVLVCDDCDTSSAHGEYWCTDHVELRNIYFHFVDRFDAAELHRQADVLKSLIAAEQGPSRKNRRTTLRKKKEQVEACLVKLADPNHSQPRSIPPRRCRACSMPYTDCPGACWGFWRRPEADTSCENVKTVEAH